MFRTTPGKRAILGIALAALHRLQVRSAEKQDRPAPQPREVRGGAPAALHIVRTDRAVTLPRHLRAPYREARGRVGQPVEGIVQRALA